MQLDQPNGFRWISEDQRRGERDRRAMQAERRVPWPADVHLKLVPSREQERVRDRLRSAGMVVR